ITDATEDELLEIDRRLAALRQASPNIEIKVDELNVEMGSIGRKEIQDSGPVVGLQAAQTKDGDQAQVAWTNIGAILVKKVDVRDAIRSMRRSLERNPSWSADGRSIRILTANVRE